MDRLVALQEPVLGIEGAKVEMPAAEEDGSSPSQQTAAPASSFGAASTKNI